jgi:hypothetical protein
MTTKLKHFCIGLILLSSTTSSFAQKYFEIFRSTILINNHTTELLRPGIMEMRISHRFGPMSSGVNEFWGLDQATIRLALEYGLHDRVNIGLGRSTYQKTVDAFAKVRILQHDEFDLVYYGNITINTLPYPDPEMKNYFSSRLAYVNQLLISRKFDESLSLILIPSIVHKNLVNYSDDPNTRFTLGLGGKYNVTKVTSIQGEYHYRFGNQDTPDYQNFNNSFSLGVGFHTKGHFFEVHLTNSEPVIDKGFLTETSGKWSNGDIRIGFNIIRDFKIRKNKK